MNNPDNFEIKYWAGGNDFFSQNRKNGRSIKKKLFIVFCFLGVLAVIPMSIYALSNFQKNNAVKVSVSKKPVFEEKQVVKEVPNDKKQKEDTKEEVLNNDSYWKISKRVCGSGKYYLSIRDQNQGAPLHKGDLVKVTCRE